MGGHRTQFSVHVPYIMSIYNVYNNVLVRVVARQNEGLTSLSPPILEGRIRDRYLALDFSNSAL